MTACGWMDSLVDNRLGNSNYGNSMPNGARHYSKSWLEGDLRVRTRKPAGTGMALILVAHGWRVSKARSGLAARTVEHPKGQRQQ